MASQYYSDYLLDFLNHFNADSISECLIGPQGSKSNHRHDHDHHHHHHHDHTSTSFASIMDYHRKKQDHLSNKFKQVAQPLNPQQLQLESLQKQQHDAARKQYRQRKEQLFQKRDVQEQLRQSLKQNPMALNWLNQRFENTMDMARKRAIVESQNNLTNTNRQYHNGGNHNDSIDSKHHNLNHLNKDNDTNFSQIKNGKNASGGNTQTDDPIRNIFETKGFRSKTNGNSNNSNDPNSTNQQQHNFHGPFPHHLQYNNIGHVEDGEEPSKNLLQRRMDESNQKFLEHVRNMTGQQGPVADGSGYDDDQDQVNFVRSKVHGERRRMRDREGRRIERKDNKRFDDHYHELNDKNFDKWQEHPMRSYHAKDDQNSPKSHMMHSWGFDRRQKGHKKLGHSSRRGFSHRAGEIHPGTHRSFDQDFELHNPNSIQNIMNTNQRDPNDSQSFHHSNPDAPYSPYHNPNRDQFPDEDEEIQEELATNPEHQPRKHTKEYGDLSVFGDFRKMKKMLRDEIKRQQHEGSAGLEISWPDGHDPRGRNQSNDIMLNHHKLVQGQKMMLNSQYGGDYGLEKNIYAKQQYMDDDDDGPPSVDVSANASEIEVGDKTDNHSSMSRNLKRIIINNPYSTKQYQHQTGEEDPVERSGREIQQQQQTQYQQSQQQQYQADINKSLNMFEQEARAQHNELKSALSNGNGPFAPRPGPTNTNFNQLGGPQKLDQQLENPLDSSEGVPFKGIKRRNGFNSNMSGMLKMDGMKKQEFKINGNNDNEKDVVNDSHVNNRKVNEKDNSNSVQNSEVTGTDNLGSSSSKTTATKSTSFPVTDQSKDSQKSSFENTQQFNNQSQGNDIDNDENDMHEVFGKSDAPGRERLTTDEADKRVSGIQRRDEHGNLVTQSAMDMKLDMATTFITSALDDTESLLLSSEAERADAALHKNPQMSPRGEVPDELFMKLRRLAQKTLRHLESVESSIHKGLEKAKSAYRLHMKVIQSGLKDAVRPGRWGGAQRDPYSPLSLPSVKRKIGGDMGMLER